MLQPDALPSLHAAIAALADPVDGWLLFYFRGINPIMAAIFGREVVGSRRAYVFIPARGTAGGAGPRRGRGAVAGVAVGVAPDRVGATR